MMKCTTLEVMPCMAVRLFPKIMALLLLILAMTPAMAGHSATEPSDGTALSD